MHRFANHPEVLKTMQAKNVVKHYNKVAQVLIEYEMLYYRAWKESVQATKQALRVPLLVRHPETKELLVNFDHLIYEVIKEAECMRKLRLDIPEFAKMLCLLRRKLKADHCTLKSLLDDNHTIRAKTPTIFMSLMTPILKRIDATIRPGLTSLTWSSMNTDTYFESVRNVLTDVDGLIKQLLDIKNSRIDEFLDEISNMLLCKLPTYESWSIETFVANTTKSCDTCGARIDMLSNKVEEAVKDLISIFSTRARAVSTMGMSPAKKPSHREAPSEMTNLEKTGHSSIAMAQARGRRDSAVIGEENWLKTECDELFAHFNHKCVESLLRSTRVSLEMVRRRCFSRGRRNSVSHSKDEERGKESTTSFFRANMILVIPNVDMHPSLDDIQAALTKGTQLVLEVSRSVIQWGEDRELVTPLEDGEVKPKQLRNYYKSIADHKDVNKTVMMLSSSIRSFRGEVNQKLQHETTYNFLWEQDREEIVKEFMGGNPTLSDFREVISKLDVLIDNIDAMQRSSSVGAIELCTDELKAGLKEEVKSWKRLYGKHLNTMYKTKLMNIMEFQSEALKKLNRPIKDLEDVRQVMITTDAIRKQYIDIDMSLGPIEEAYSIFSLCDMVVTKDELDSVDSLRYSFEKLTLKAAEIQDELLDVQPHFRSELLDAVSQFTVDVEDFEDSYNKKGPMVDGIAPAEASERLSIYQSLFDDLWSKFGTYSAGESLFGMPSTEFQCLHKIKKELNLLQKLYNLYNAVMVSINGYYEIMWVEVDIEKINVELLDFQSRIRKLPKGLKEWQAFLDLQKKIDDFNESCPLLELMANKAMKPRHWDRMSALTGHKFDLDSDTFALKNIMDAPLLKFKEDIEDICISAVKEKDIEAKLAVVVTDWSTQVLSFSQFKTRGELLLKGTETQEIVSLLEDSLMVLSSLLSNRYNAPFKKKIQEWVSNLSNTSDIIENWMIVQNLWVYLEAVFVGGDIAKQLPQEAKRFSNIDKTWVRIMNKAHETPNVVECCVGDETLGQLLPHLLEQLEMCQKSLTGYLEGKRLIFPRFFFVSDPALLEILGQASDSHTIQAHLLGIFENVASVEFHEKDYDRILSCISREGEVVPLEKPLIARGNVEVWLGDLLVMQQKSLHAVIREAYQMINDQSFELLPFFNDYIAQVGLIGIQMLWTKESEEALAQARYDKKAMQLTNQRFLDMLNSLIDQTTRDLGKFERIKYETLITIHVHQRDIFDDLVRMHIKSVNDFEWLKQSRFYFKEDLDHCIVQITDVNFIYQNEFLGCTDRLVITPLTDR
ncbi:Dynein heavy chain 8, axonemal [Lamellibrachia satsuma]|nr:Dynein heavy chain 8, axonemal [Lamellibrachia satsuma]